MGVRDGGCFAKVGLGSIPVLGGSTIKHDSQKAEQR